MMINAQRQLIEEVREQLIVLPTFSGSAVNTRFIEHGAKPGDG